jgi:hypothetical protein
MAGDWIKVEHTTPDKPEVMAMAELLDFDTAEAMHKPDAIVGKLIRLWVWADQQTFDGEAGGNGVSVTKAFLDRLTCCDGFASALESVGWLKVEDGRVVFPNFSRHNLETAKSRALGRNRKARHDAKGNADGVTSALPNRSHPTQPERKRTNTLTQPPPSAPEREPASTSAAGSVKGVGDSENGQKGGRGASARRRDAEATESFVTPNGQADKAKVLELYCEAVAEGVIVKSEANALRFFAEARYVARRTKAGKIRDPIAVLRSNARAAQSDPTRWHASHGDEDAARKVLKQLRDAGTEF